MTKSLNIQQFYSPNYSSDTPLSNRCPIDRPLNYFQKLENKLGYRSQALHVATITIGNKYYGCMDYIQQYNHVVKSIKQTYRYHGETKYWFCFELQANGQLHAHGIIYNGYHAKFIEGFQKFGARNLHKDSYQPLRNKGYLSEYIHKDVLKKETLKIPPIHNITKKTLQTMESVKAEGGNVEEATIQAEGVSESGGAHLRRSGNAPNITI